MSSSISASQVLVVALTVASACREGSGPRQRVTVAATATPLSHSQAAVSVTMSGQARVAAACARRDDPTEVHLLEAHGWGRVELRFAGLLPATDYDCKVAPTSAAGPSVSVGFRTADPPERLASAEVVAHPQLAMTGAYTVMNVRGECRGEPRNSVVVLDPEGNHRFGRELPEGTNIGIEVTLDGRDRLLWGGGKSSAGAPTVIDVHGGDVWRLAFPGSDRAEFHHEAQRIDDGRVLSVEDSYDAGWAAFRLRLSEASGATSWLWGVERAVDAGWLWPGDAQNPDPHHVNWADVVDTDRGLVAYASLCFAFLVVAIDVESGEPLWRFGSHGDFTLVDAGGHALADQDDFPQCQHGLQTDGTHLLVYDNGLDRERTRAVEYTLDLDRMTAHKTWEWGDEGFWEKYHGGVEWLTPDHDRVLVAEGNNDCGRKSDRHSQVVEVDRTTGAEVHRLILRELGDRLYRAHRVEGCELFANAKYCPALADRLSALGAVFDP